MLLPCRLQQYYTYNIDWIFTRYIFPTKQVAGQEACGIVHQYFDALLFRQDPVSSTSSLSSTSSPETLLEQVGSR